MHAAAASYASNLQKRINLRFKINKTKQTDIRRRFVQQLSLVFVFLEANGKESVTYLVIDKHTNVGRNVIMSDFS